jgi:hypothetical protein
MITVEIQGNKAKIIETETLPTGSLNFDKILFSIEDPSWEGAALTATFSALMPTGSRKTLPSVVDDEGIATVPEKIMSTKGSILSVGLCGSWADNKRITTNMVDICKLLPGAAGDDLQNGLNNLPDIKDVFDYVDEKYHKSEAEIAELDAYKHNHSNKDILDKWGERDGKPVFNGNPISSEVTISDVIGLQSVLDTKANEDNVYDKSQVDVKFENKANKSEVYNREQVDVALTLKADKTSVDKNIEDISTLKTDKADKSEIPVVPTKVSAFENDIGYLTEHQDISGKQDKLIPGENITIEGDVISATGGGSDAKEPFYADYGETPYEEVKQAIVDGRDVYVVYDDMLCRYVGHNKGKPYDVESSVSGYVFKFVCVDGATTGNFTGYFVRLRSTKSQPTIYNVYDGMLVNDNMLMVYAEGVEYTDEEILTAKGVMEAIESALANIPSAEGGSY